MIAQPSGDRNDPPSRRYPEAVSNVVGAVVLIGVAVLAMGIVIAVLISGSLPTQVPSFSGIITNTSNTVYITHEGGDPLIVGQFQVLVNGRDVTGNFTKSLGSDKFSVGMIMNATFTSMPQRVVVVYNSSWGGGTVLASADLHPLVSPAPPGWYNGDWVYRKKITIDHTKVIGSDHADFPVLVKIDDPELDDTDYVRTDGYDMFFTASDGTTPRSYEVEYFARNGGHLIAWVKVPTLSSSADTVLYLYYGNPGAPNQQSPGSVWDSNYKGVWHLADDPSISTDGDCGGGTKEVCDSTANNADGDSLGSMTSADLVTARIDGGYEMDGTDDAVDTADAPFDFTGNFTMSAWVDRTTGGSTSRHVISKRFGGGGSGGFSLAVGNMGEVYCQTDNGASNVNSYTAQGVVTAAAGWQFLVAIRAGSTCRIYVNNADLTSTFGTHTTMATNNYALRIGEHTDGTDNWLGYVDEVRVSDVARSLNWMTTEYNNQNNPGTFIFVGGRQTQTTMS
ncbi:MAG: DUF2341 domain-containing protein [Methanomicrobiales archaeon]|nr:DUF2341 domain-containing protein [Methanomicrobiales archaeon]